MKDDVLASAARALRESTANDDASARFTRSRIMASVHRGRVRRRTRLAFLIPIAASFIAVSAWGAASGRASLAFAAVTRALGWQTPAVHGSNGAARGAGVREMSARNGAAQKTDRALATESTPIASPTSATNSNDVPAEHTPSASAPGTNRNEPPPGTRPSGAPPSAGRNDAPPVVAARNTSAGSNSAGRVPNENEPGYELYRAAHRAHFVDRDPNAALDAWDAYLRAAPNGAFALEARYNRALDLIRLKRTAEARAALTPFAQGQFGNYRQKTASDLLDALPH